MIDIVLQGNAVMNENAFNEIVDRYDGPKNRGQNDESRYEEP